MGIVTRQGIHIRTILLSLLLITGCQRATYYSTQHLGNAIATASNQNSVDGPGTGEDFEGRVVVTPYYHQDPSQPCLQHDQSGKPIANDVIKVFRLNTVQTAQQTQKDCVLLNPPLALNNADLSFAAGTNGALTYQGQVYAPDATASSRTSSLGSWTTWGATITNPVPATLLPDGLTPSQLFVEDNTSTSHRVYTTYGPTVTGVNYTASYYVKRASRDYALLIFEDPAQPSTHQCGCGFDLNVGVPDGNWGEGGSTTAICSIQAVGSGGWYLISTSCAPNTSGTQMGVALEADTSATGNGIYQGTGSPVYYFGAGVMSW